MTPSRLLLAVAMLSAVSAASPARADTRSPMAGVKRDDHDLPPEVSLSPTQALTHTDPQFAALLRGARDPKSEKLVSGTHEFFNQEIQKLPDNAVLTGAQVNSVGPLVGDLLKVVAKWEDDRNRARNDGERDAADQRFVAKKDVITHQFTALMAPVHMDTTGGGAENTTAGHGLAPTTNTQPAPPTIKIDEIVDTAVANARRNLPPDPPTPTPTPTPTPAPAPVPDNNGVPGGNGASSNGPIPGGQTLGQLLGVSNPNSPSDALGDAKERARDGDIAGGIADATRAINLGGGADAYAFRGGLQLDRKDFSAARNDAGRALELDPNNREAMAVAHLAKVSAPSVALPGGPAGSSVPGESAASAAMAANAAAARASRMSGEQAKKEAQNAMKLGDLGGALVYVNRALAENPNNPDLLNMRAAIYARQHDYESSIKDAKAGLALAPNNKTLLKTLGYSQLRGRHFKDAKETASAMLALDPADPYAFALRAHAEGSMGDRDAMMADINRAARLDPRYAATAADLAKLVELPSDQDVLFLFPGEVGPSPAKPAAGGRGRSFGLLVGASAVGGLLLALGLLTTVLAPLKDRVTSAFTRITAPAGAAVTTEQPASVNGLAPGLIRGQYEVSRQIGAGGMGMVFAGTDRSLGRPVAIKKMREELRVNPQERARFVIEAKTVAALHHPNIVDIYAIAEDGDDVYLIFEYVDGKTAHELVQKAGRLPIPQAARVVRAAADALDYAHARGVIHRDMKPSNVMIDSTGRVKVMDFGIARMAKDSMTRYSMTNTVVGTPPYMAPEQEQGHVRRESDVYALAVCAYEMLTGKLPFIGIGAGMLMNKINMSYVAPSHATAGMPAALDEVFAKAFQAEPDKRYRTPKEFADALESALPSAVRA